MYKYLKMMAAISSEKLVAIYHNEQCPNAKGSKGHGQRHFFHEGKILYKF